MTSRGPRSATRMDEVRDAVADLGLPVVIRPSFTMGGLGSGMAYTPDELDRIAGAGLAASPVHEVLIEESVLGWKEYELELMRDGADNAVVVCSIENLDPMGVHTGDSITVAPAMTLTDREYQAMRDLGLAILRAVGVATGGCNIQFAIDPATGRMIVIEMNPRVSRSSALASKATGFPIAKIAAKLAIGYTLDEIANDITKATPAAFEPSLDYVVVKIPRFAFEKFPGADPDADHHDEVGRRGDVDRPVVRRGARQGACGRWRPSCPDSGPARLGWQLPAGLRATARSAAGSRCGSRPTAGSTASSGRLRWGATVEQVHRGHRHRPVVPRPDRADHRGRQRGRATPPNSTTTCCAPPSATGCPTCRSPRCGRCSGMLGSTPRRRSGPAAGRPASARSTRPSTPARRSSRPARRTTTRPTRPIRPPESEVAPQTDRPKVIILGSGPNRIGQGIEFDYSCVHAALALRDAGYETVMVNCNPETVSTDYDTSDRLYFEPLTDRGRAGSRCTPSSESGTVAGVIVTLGGQTPLEAGRHALRGRRGCRSSAPSRTPSTWRRTAAGSATC